MSTVVNGHREDDNAHARPHGHVLPMLSFSASTPTEEDNPLDNNPAIAIDMTLWEQPEDATGAGPSIAISNEDDGDEGMNPEAVPLIDVNRDVVLVDGPMDDDEPGENDPLLAGGGGGRGCGDISESGFGGLGIPVNMPRRPEEKEDGGQHQQKLQNGIHSDASVNELRDVASQLVCEVISQAQAQASRSNLNDKEDAASAAEGTTEEEGAKTKRGPQNLASPASNHAERFFRGGPWYVQMGRVFSAFVSRICPCRCPTKP